MNKQVFLIASILLFAGCEKELSYDISLVGKEYVVNAYWYAGDTNHDVYICTSNAYNVTEPETPATVSCIVNGTLVCEVSDYKAETTYSKIRFHKYSISADLKEGDSVELRIEYPDAKLWGTSIVPFAPRVQLDSSSVSKNMYDGRGRIVQEMRAYNFELSLSDVSGENSYYRLMSPFVHTETRRIEDDELTEVREWPWLPFNEEDPVFKNTIVQFPFEVLLEFPFLSGSSNGTHVFSDELFRDESYKFHFDLDQGEYGRYPSCIVYTETTVRFRLYSIPWEEYTYLLATNAAVSSYSDPMAEPVIMPYNINGGLGFFSIDNGFDKTITLKRCHVYHYEE